MDPTTKPDTSAVTLADIEALAATTPHPELVLHIKSFAAFARQAEQNNADFIKTMSEGNAPVDPVAGDYAAANLCDHTSGAAVSLRQIDAAMVQQSRAAMAAGQPQAAVTVTLIGLHASMAVLRHYYMMAMLDVAKVAYHGTTEKTTHLHNPLDVPLATFKNILNGSGRLNDDNTAVEMPGGEVVPVDDVDEVLTAFDAANAVDPDFNVAVQTTSLN